MVVVLVEVEVGNVLQQGMTDMYWVGEISDLRLSFCLFPYLSSYLVGPTLLSLAL